MTALSRPLMVMVLALVVDAALDGLPPGLNVGSWMDRLAARLGRLAPWLVPAPFTAAALLVGWVNASDALVTWTSVWLLAGCLSLPRPDAGAAPPLERLTAFVAPLFYYALLGVPGAVLCRAVQAVRGQAAWLDRLLALVPRWLAAGALALAGWARGRGSVRQSAPATSALDEDWRTARLAAWIAAGTAALSLYPRHAFLL